MSEEEVTLNPNGPYTYRSLVVQGGTWWDNENLLETPITKHYGPGPHASGSPQSVHGGSTMRSGIREIDEAIEAFLREPAGDWTTDNCPIGDFTPEQTHGSCVQIADQFAAFANARGLNAYAVDTDLDELGYKVKGKPSGEVLDDDGNIVQGRYFTHTVNEIYLPDRSWPITIDFAASQYGYPTKVLVTKHHPGGKDHDQKTHGRRGSGGNAGPAGDDEYRGQHQPSGEYDSPLHELNRNVPDDIYTNPEYYFHMDADAWKSYRIMRGARGKPDQMVTIYRAVPVDVTEINPGDWVTLTREYAELHASGGLGGYHDEAGEWQPNPSNILSKEVRAAEVRWPADSVAEFGWWPDLVEKHYPGGKDHDQKLHGRRGSVSRRIHADQPNLFVDQPRLGDPEPPKPSLIGRDRPPSTGPLKIADDYVLGKWVEDSYGKGWKDNIDEIVKIREHIDKDPVGALNGLGEHYRWLASKEQVARVATRTAPIDLIDGSDPDIAQREFQRLKEQWMYEDDNVLALMSEAAEKAEPILIADGERIAEEIRLAEKTKKTAGGPLDRPKSPTWARGFYYETEGDSASDENAMYRNFIERVAPEQSAQVDKAFELHEQSKVKDDKQRAVFDKFREVTRQPNSEYDERYEVPRDLFTPSTLAEYDKNTRVMQSLYANQNVDYGNLRTSHWVSVEIDDGFVYSEDLGDVVTTRVAYRREAVDVTVGAPFEGEFMYTTTNDIYFTDKGDLSLRRNKSMFDEGNLQPLFFAASDDMQAGNVDLNEWAQTNAGGDSVLVTRNGYKNLLRKEGLSLERGARRDHKKAKGIINIVDANLKQSGGLEQTVIDVLGKRRDMGGTIDVHGRGTTQAAKQLQMAAEAYPTEWVDRSNDAGPLRVVGKDYVRAMYTNEYRRTLRRKPGESRYGRRSSVIESRILVSPGGVLRDDTLHELAHRMEHVIPEIRILERNFYARRTKGETFQRLSRLTGNSDYGTEVAKPDKWGIPYMGKEYGVRGAPTRIHSGDHFPTTSEAYELLTTAYPVITGRADNDLDDEHRNLMLGILANI